MDNNHDPETAVIRVEHVEKRYGATVAVRDATLTVQRGSIFGFLGHNGSGKSTTVRMISGMTAPTSGTIVVNGMNFRENRHAIASELGVLPEGLALFDRLTVWEHMQLVGHIFEIQKDEIGRRAEKLLSFLDLWKDRDRFAQHISFGMGKKLALAMALIHNPKILILDEPFEGLDPIYVRCIRELLQQLASRGVTVFVTSHSIPLVEKTVDAFAIISNGTIVFQSTTQEVTRKGNTIEDIFFRFVKAPEIEELEWINASS